jgi:hypothetical protein
MTNRCGWAQIWCRAYGAPWQAGAGTFGGRPSGPQIRGEFAVSFHPWLDRGNSAAPSKIIATKGPLNRRSLGYPGFPVGIGGVGELHAAFLNESRTRGGVQCSEAGNPATLLMTSQKLGR